MLFARPILPGAYTAPGRPASVGDVAASATFHPKINASGCVFLPVLASPLPLACGEGNGGIQLAYVGQPIGLNLTVSEPYGLPINVTVWWDVQLNFSTYPYLPEPVNASAVQYFDVVPAGPNQTVEIRAQWAYSAPGRNVGGMYPAYHVYVNATSSSGYDAFRQGALLGCFLPWGNCYFDIAVAAANAAPSVEGLEGSYRFSVSAPDWTVPEFTANVTVEDPDDDPVNVTWDWGDGTVTVNRTPPARSGVVVLVAHRYILALNATPWLYNFTLNLSVDDGVAGHNTTVPISVEYYVGLDQPPSPTIVKPTGVERLVTGRNVAFVGLLSDYEGDPMFYYWDFGDGRNTSLVGPVQAGSVSVNHTYAAEGNYSVLLWASDGLDKRLCFGTDCTRTHWVNSTKKLHVDANSPPVASLTVSSRPSSYGHPAGFAIAIYDVDGDPMTVTWDFGDEALVGADALSVNKTPEGVIQNDLTQNHTYTQWGDPAQNFTFNVTVWADDGQGHNVSRSTEIFIGSDNMPPLITPGLFLSNETAWTNAPFRLEVNITDPDGDPVDLAVDFGDGSPVAQFLAQRNGTVALNHSYADADTYTVNITATDHKLYVFIDNRTGLPNWTAIPHDVDVSLSILVEVPPVVKAPEPWTWLDYTTLAIVLGLPSAYLVRSAYLRRQERAED